MKKYYTIISLILSSVCAYALPVGNPYEPALCNNNLFCDCNIGFRLGFYGDYVFNQHMKVKRNSSDLLGTKLTTNAGYLAFNFCQRLDLFTTLGASSIHISADSLSFDSRFENDPTESDYLTLDTGTDFSWSLGARAILYECGCTAIGFEGQYFCTNPTLKVISFGEQRTYPDDEVNADYREWQVGLGISHRKGCFIPYAAIKWHHATLDFDNVFLQVTPLSLNTLTLLTLESEDGFGYAVGLSIITCEKISLTAEARFAGQRALYINGQICF